MTRTAIYLGFVLVAMAAAGAFGALHDQISYTVAPEYFTRFKFIQFHLLDPRVPERVRAAQVGFLASWWMGLPLGLLIGLGGFLQPTPARMLQALLASILVSFAFTLAVALAGLAYGYWQTAHIDRAAYAGWFVPIGVTDLRRFLCAGYMHDAAYLGGALAIPVAWGFLIYVWARRSVPPA
ncbi:MAG TPA: hypothetical protein VKX28_13285 [Xanthobacteraceae bacterium]|jgi:hypothetical protein|nr:hypothetical protein [Xanthobacteraceae bacterium]